MKKRILITLSLALALSLGSCATLFTPHVTDCQKRKPQPGQPARQVKIVPMIADIIIFLPGLAVDFATGAIYKPCETKTK